uniref:Small ribosomal subunit protein mS26 n=1 Tax=Ditylenchus dipsaci TaxID=166011 RepID=A0A915EG16_9BILA
MVLSSVFCCATIYERDESAYATSWKAACSSPSKTKLYHVPKPLPWVQPQDVQDMLWRRHVYNNAFISLRRVFKEEFEKYENNEGLEELKRLEREELDRLLDANNKRNEANAIERAEREKVKAEALRLKILEDIEKTLEKEDEDIQKREIEVQEAIRLSANFVTKYNLEEKILEALENPTVFDFAIDLEGKKFYLDEPDKYILGLPKVQKGRSYDRTRVRKVEAVNPVA